MTQKLILCLAALFVVSNAGAAEMLFTTLTTTESRPLGATTTLHIEVDGLGIQDKPALDWIITLTADLDGDTLLGDKQTLGAYSYWNFNRYLSNGLGDGGLNMTLRSSGGGGTTWGKPAMFEDHDGSMGCCAQSESNFTPLNGLDMTGFHLTKMELEFVDLTFTSTTVSGTFALAIFGDDGQIPEPSSAALMLFGLSLLIAHHTPHWRR